MQSTTEDQGQVPFAADVADAFAALGLLTAAKAVVDFFQRVLKP